MDWFRQVNSYCERMGPEFWAEPVNAVTNAAFLIAALWAWRLAQRAGDRGGQWLALVLGAIGVGSFLFHTYAQVWAALADTLPILVFILSYIHLATVRFYERPVWQGALAVALFVPYSAAVSAGLGAVVGDLNGSISYVPVPILIAGYALGLRARAPETARGLLIGAGILAVSLVFRSTDMAVCAAVPLGTHFMWHVLNAVMLAWMIRVAVRHGTAERAAAPVTGAR